MREALTETAPPYLLSSHAWNGFETIEVPYGSLIRPGAVIRPRPVETDNVRIGKERVVCLPLGIEHRSLAHAREWWLGNVPEDLALADAYVARGVCDQAGFVLSALAGRVAFLGSTVGIGRRTHVVVLSREHGRIAESLVDVSMSDPRVDTVCLIRR